MSKAILVIDMPESCKECMCYVLGASNNFCGVTRFAIFDNTSKPNNCPLKPVPDERYEGGTWTMSGYIEDGFSSGWNACIEEILCE